MLRYVSSAPVPVWIVVTLLTEHIVSVVWMDIMEILDWVLAFLASLVHVLVIILALNSLILSFYKGGPGSGYQHADTCYIAPQNQSVVCNCKHGYIGQYCDQCQVNFWGNPREIAGSCEKCHCHDNIDFNVSN